MRVLVALGLLAPGIARAQTIWVGDTPGAPIDVRVGGATVVPVYADVSGLSDFDAWEWTLQHDADYVTAIDIALGSGPGLDSATDDPGECVDDGLTEGWQSGTTDTPVLGAAIHLADLVLGGDSPTSSTPLTFLAPDSICTDPGRATWIDDGTDVIGLPGCTDCDSTALVAVDTTLNVGFVRGDSNGDGFVDVSDAAHLRDSIYVPFAHPCEDAGDMTDSETIGDSDIVDILELSIVEATLDPPAPYPDVGQDPTPGALPCGS